MKTLSVELAERTYPILLGSTAEWIGKLADLLSGRRTLLVTDENIRNAGHLDALLSRLERYPQINCTVCVLPPGEEHKTLSTVEKICRTAADAGLDRKSIMVALSGGVIGDLTGFSAAVYMRGIDFIQLPTTLLAAVDSSVGGKTGADLPEGKNLVGAFHQPKLVALDMSVLATLPESEWRNGLAEAVKYGMIMDADFLSLLEQNIDKLNARDPEFFTEVIYRSCRCKSEVVAGDEREQGRRAILNYGHTAGHAVEKLSNFTLPHGEAVAIGMAAAAHLAVNKGLCPAELENRQNRLLNALGLSTRLPDGSDIHAIRNAMLSDKKNSGGKINMILPLAAGNVEFIRGIDDEILLKSLGEIL